MVHSNMKLDNFADIKDWSHPSATAYVLTGTVMKMLQHDDEWLSRLASNCHHADKLLWTDINPCWKHTLT